MKQVVRALLPKAVKPHRVLGGPLRGARILTSWHDYPAAILGRTERPLLEWLRTHVVAGQTWLDVGAHYGYTAIWLSRCVGPTGRVFAFEPVMATAGYVAQTRLLNQLENLSVMAIGLGSPETLTSIRPPIARGMADQTIVSRSDDTLETVQIARFDWLWPQINEAHDTVDGVKIDVQGMELDVVIGMREVLRRHHPTLVIEFHRGVDRAAVVDALVKVGYRAEATGIEPEPSGLIRPHELADDRSYVFLPDARG